MKGYLFFLNKKGPMGPPSGIDPKSYCTISGHSTIDLQPAPGTPGICYDLLIFKEKFSLQGDCCQNLIVIIYKL